MITRSTIALFGGLLLSLVAQLSPAAETRWPPPTAGTSGSQGNPQYNSGSGFGADAGIINVATFAGIDPTGTSDSGPELNTLVTLAEGKTPCATLYFPNGRYKINTKVVTHSTEGCAWVGNPARAYDQEAGATLFTTNTSFTMVSINDACSAQVQAGITIKGLTFYEEDANALLSPPNATPTDTLLKLCGVMRFNVNNNNFLFGQYATHVMAAAGIDSSDGIFINNHCIKNQRCYYQDSGGTNSTGFGQNDVAHNYIVDGNIAAGGSVGVTCLENSDGSLTVEYNRFDGPYNPIYTTCQVTNISNNKFEGGWYQAIYTDSSTATSGGTSAGGWTTSVGNLFVGATALQGINISCTPDNASTTWVCANVTNLVPGMEIRGTNVVGYSYPSTYGSGSVHGGQNLLVGATYIMSIPDSTHITVNQVATANTGSQSLFFCQGVYEQISNYSGGYLASAHAQLAVATVGNIYQNVGNCYSGSGGSIQLVGGQ